ncbi:MAG: shikimate dehydrogenase [Candidatus Diapherotrites archaeon]
MNIDRETKKCISISEKPGSFGVDFHNRFYNKLNLNYVYFPLKVDSSQLKSMTSLLKENFHGCSVSMPHKKEVINFLDELDDSAREIGVVNTILNKDGLLVGYNTDYYGAKKAIQEKTDINNKEVLMMGAGSVATAIGYAIRDLGGKLTIANRNFEKARDLAKRLNANVLNWDERNKSPNKFLLINATSIGFCNKEDTPIEKESISNYEVVMDVVIGDTNLIKTAKKLSKTVIPGFFMTTHQAAKQFEIYTSKEIPNSLLEDFLRENGK